DGPRRIADPLVEELAEREVEARGRRRIGGVAGALRERLGHARPLAGPPQRRQEEVFGLAGLAEELGGQVGPPAGGGRQAFELAEGGPGRRLAVAREQRG